MRLSRFYVAQALHLGEQTLPEATAHYMAKVLRLKSGDAVQLFDGSGQEFRGVLSDVGKKTVQADLSEQFTGQPDSPLHVHLGQVLSRGERMDWAIQKATELGVNRITPLFSERCEVRLSDERQDKRLQHWQQVAISACEQCGRSTVPEILTPQPLADWQAQRDEDLRLVLHPEHAQPIASLAKPQRLALLIGPEGGLTDSEVTAACAAGFTQACFGPRVLRTETAPIVALSLAQQLWGDF